LALTSTTSGDRSFGIVHSWTKATQFSCSFICFSSISQDYNYFKPNFA
jgi:hypothetical protein